MITLEIMSGMRVENINHKVTNDKNIKRPLANILAFAGFFHPHIGGAEAVMHDVLTFFAKQGYRVQLCTCNTEKTLTHEILDGIEIWRVPCWNLLSGTYPIPIPVPRTFQIITRLFRQRQDVIFSYGRFYASTLTGCLLSKIKGIPLMHSEFGSSHSVTSSGLVNLISKFYDHTIGSMVIKSANILTGNCRATAAFLVHLGGRNIVVISPPSGIDLDVFTKSPTKLKNNFGLTEKVIITSVSRLIYAKGIQDLISAIPLIKKNIPNVVLLIVGDGPYKNDLIKLSQKIGRSEIHFLGQKNHKEIAEVMNITDVLVNTSYSEGLIAIPVIEAGALGIPSVTTDAGGTTEIIENGKTGLIVKAGDVSAIAQKVCQLLNDAELRGQISNNVKQLVDDKFNPEKIMPLYLREIESLISKKRAADAQIKK